MIAVGYKTDIRTFFQAGMAGAFKIPDTGAQAGLFQKQLNIAGLTVADDKKRRGF